MRHLLYLPVVMTLSGAVSAQAFCEDVKALMRGAGAMSLALPLDEASHVKCTTSQDLSGVQAVNCAWPFAYRSEAASTAFEGALVALESCFGTKGAQDLGVNHPDFYDLRTFRSAHGEVGVSIKDKGALQQTYVFLRIMGLPQ